MGEEVQLLILRSNHFADESLPKKTFESHSGACHGRVCLGLPFINKKCFMEFLVHFFGAL